VGKQELEAKELETKEKSMECCLLVGEMMEEKIVTITKILTTTKTPVILSLRPLLPSTTLSRNRRI